MKNKTNNYHNYTRLWNCNTLWKLWYAILVIGLESFLIYHTIHQYIVYKSQHYNPRHGNDWNMAPLHFYLACIILAVSLMNFLVYFCLINTIMDSTIISDLEYDRISMKQKFSVICRVVMRKVRENWPYASSLHLIIATCLILPIPWMHMEQIRNDVRAPESVWNTDLNFLGNFFDWPLEPSLADRSVSSHYNQLHYIATADSTAKMSVEVINYLIALVIFMLNFGNSFWNSNRLFSIASTFIVLFNGLMWLLIYEALAIIIKFSGLSLENSSQIGTIINLNNYQKIDFNYCALTSLLIIHFLVVLVSWFVLYDYAHTQILLRYFKYLSTNCELEINHKIWFLPILIVGFSLVAILVIIDAILFSAIYEFYSKVYPGNLFFICLISGGLNLLVWLLCWLFLIVYKQWTFKFYSDTTSQRILSSDLERRNTITNSELTCISANPHKFIASPETIYGCFHSYNPNINGNQQNYIISSGASSHSSSNGMHMNHLYQVNPDNALTNAVTTSSSNNSSPQNYVCLQGINNACSIPTICENITPTDNYPNQTKIESSTLCNRQNNDPSLHIMAGSTYHSLQQIPGSTTNLQTNSARKLVSFSNEASDNRLRVPDIINNNGIPTSTNSGNHNNNNRSMSSCRSSNSSLNEYNNETSSVTSGSCKLLQNSIYQHQSQPLLYHNSNSNNTNDNNNIENENHQIQHGIDHSRHSDIHATLCSEV